MFFSIFSSKTSVLWWTLSAASASISICQDISFVTIGRNDYWNQIKNKDMLDTTGVFIFFINFIHLYCGARDFFSQVYDSVNKNYLNFKLEKEIKKEEFNYNKNSSLSWFWQE